MRFVRALLAAAVATFAIAPVALAQGLTITTPFPAVVVDPGGTAEFNVTVTTEAPERVDLSVADQPEGWTTTLRGGGSTIAAVTTAADPAAGNQIRAAFTVEVEVPDDAGVGSNQVEIQARSASGVSAPLTLDLTIAEQEAGAVILESEFPTQGGSPDDAFEFDLELRNDSNQEVTLRFEADPPPGWRATVRPGTGETDATTAVLEAGGISSVNVNIDPSPDAAVGVYNIPVRAIGGPAPAQAEVSVEITGSFGLDLTTSDQRLDARVTAGSPTTLTLVLTNTGTAPLTDVALTATPPRNWDVTFAQETVPNIDPGASQTVEATVQPAGTAVAGDYVLTINARNADANDRIEVRTTVETSPIGGIIGIVILIVVAAGLFLVFQRYGRR
jgi:uncharacterized membrane protein